MKGAGLLISFALVLGVIEAFFKHFTSDFRYSKISPEKEKEFQQFRSPNLVLIFKQHNVVEKETISRIDYIVQSYVIGHKVVL